MKKFGFPLRSATLALLLSSALASCTSVTQTSEADLKTQRSVSSLPKPDTFAATYAVGPQEATATPATASAAATLQAQPGQMQTAATQTAPSQRGPATQLMAMAAVGLTGLEPSNDPLNVTATATTQVAATAPAAPMTNAVTTPATAVASTIPNAIDSVTIMSRFGASPMQVAFDARPAAATPIALTPEMAAIQSSVPTPMPRPGVMMAYASTSKSNRLATMDARPEPMVPELPGPVGNRQEINALISKYSAVYKVPEALIHRVVIRESKYDPTAYSRGHFGLMQIKYATARSMGFTGRPEGLFDAETNLKYAIKYLRGAWMVSDSSHDGAVRLYARGYYYDAKRKGLLSVLK